MFQWGITLSDKQVIMLTAFQTAAPDEEGSIFHSAHSMIADAWDVRAVRKLEEQNLITVSKGKQTIWAITKKGRLIAQAIMCDAENLRRLKFRHGHEAQGLIQDEANSARLKRKHARSVVKP